MAEFQMEEGFAYRLESGDFARGKMDSLGDFDHAWVNLTAGANYYFATANGLDTKLRLYDQDLILVMDGDPTAAGSVIHYQAQKSGIFFVEIFGSSRVGTYSLSFSQVRTKTGTNSDNVLGGGAERDLIDGRDGDDRISGLGGDDVLTGGYGNDVLDGGPGNDQLSGLWGNDTYYVNSRFDEVFEWGSDRGDKVITTLNVYTAIGDIEILVFAGTGSFTGKVWGGAAISGGAWADTLTGSNLDDVLNGLAGADTMIGQGGDDTYVVDDGDDKVVEDAFAGSGVDTVKSIFSYALAADLENLTLTGAAAIDATGNGVANVLVGNAAANRLDGKGGADSMTGGAGDDIYTVDHEGDRVFEAVGGGIDKVNSAVGFILGANIENLTLTGTASVNATGNGLANELSGNAGANLLNGMAGADTMIGRAGNDTYAVDNASDVVVELVDGGVDTVRSAVSWTLGAHVENLVLAGSLPADGTGNALANSLTGNGAANRLDGMAGSDVMTGGRGDDVYIVDSRDDRVIEGSNQGIDTVFASSSFDLDWNVERLVLTGSANTTAIGSFDNNRLTGNPGNNTLDGQFGADTMAGGAGNDSYVVDQAGDVVNEAAGAGIDKVSSLISYILPAEVEQLVLIGVAPIKGTGNAHANSLTGNWTDNVLDGKAGADTMVGGDGDDVYVVDNAGDGVFEHTDGGADRVDSSISYTLGAGLEHLTLLGTAAIDGTGNAAANAITGNGAANKLQGLAGADTLKGGADSDTLGGGDGRDKLDGGTGNDRLNGGRHNDTLTGGTGADRFYFNSGLVSNVDAIADFSAADDSFYLSRPVFAAFASAGPIAASAFRLGSAAADANDHILYDSATGSLYYDADGNAAGAPVPFATVTPGTALAAADFIIYG